MKFSQVAELVYAAAMILPEGVTPWAFAQN